MVLSCLVCKLKINTADKSVSFHKFPKNENTKTKWLQVLDIADIKPSSRICSHHFKAEDFTLGTLNLKLRLKWTAIPSVNLKRNLQTDLYNIKTSSNQKIIYNQKNDIMLKNHKIERVAIETIPTRSNLLKRQNYIFYRKFLQNEDDDGLPLKNERRLSDINIDDVSKSSVEAKMCLEVAMEEIKEQGYKIRQLKKKVNRLESVICDLRSLVKELKYKKFLSMSNDTLNGSSLDKSGDEFNS
ncbi:THAP domain-containing protein 6-like isoform X2 [Vespula squamosa]|uniref:THAP domain-containing protein 6-like isoform X2 n=1 Tax=Vespula squamosa TaxID=30214 RepID=A0ABD2C644_VESSQ